MRNHFFSKQDFTPRNRCTSVTLINYIMSKKRILIVEDEALTVLALKHELTELGYEIAGDASTAADALRAAEDNHADLVLMDIQLDGGISGIAAAAAIRGHLDIPIMFLTAHASAETVGRAVESGAFGYLLKPYPVPELKAPIAMRFTNTIRKSRCAGGSVHGCRPTWRDRSPSERKPIVQSAPRRAPKLCDGHRV